MSKINPDRFYSPKELIVENGGILPLSLNSIYTAIGRGDIKTKKIGRRIVIHGRDLIHYLGIEA